VLGNLIHNAIVTPDRVPSIGAILSAKITVSVADTGVGIPRMTCRGSSSASTKWIARGKKAARGWG
jgi:hypothetical protein